MPKYTYECQECKSVVEKYFSISEKPSEFEEKCPHCENITKFKSIITNVNLNYTGVNHGRKIPSDLKNRFDQMRKMYPNMNSSY